MSKEMALISRLILKASTIVGRVEAACQCGVTWSKCELMMRPLGKRKDDISTMMMDFMTLLIIGSKLMGLQLKGSVFAPFSAML